jgi:hypothetical protein
LDDPENGVFGSFACSGLEAAHHQNTGTPTSKLL